MSTSQNAEDALRRFLDAESLRIKSAAASTNATTTTAIGASGIFAAVVAMRDAFSASHQTSSSSQPPTSSAAATAAPSPSLGAEVAADAGAPTPVTVETAPLPARVASSLKTKEDPLKKLLQRRLQGSAASTTVAAAPLNTPAAATTTTSAAAGASLSPLGPWFARPLSAMDDLCWDAFRQFTGVAITANGASAAQTTSATSTTPSSAPAAADGTVLRAVADRAMAPRPLRCWEELIALMPAKPEAEAPARQKDHDVLHGLLEAFASRLGELFVRGPTPVQTQALPAALIPHYAPHRLTASRSGGDGSAPAPLSAALGADILGVAETGSGKTVCFLLPALLQVFAACAAVRPDGSVSIAMTPADAAKGPVALVVVPTRELVQQVSAQLDLLCGKTSTNAPTTTAATSNSKTFRSPYTEALATVRSLAVGGDSSPATTNSAEAQRMRLQAGVHIVVGSPGQLLSLARQRAVGLQGLRYVAVDEMDRLIEESVGGDIAELLALCPAARQTVLFTATLSAPCRAMAAQCLRSPLGSYTVTAEARQTSITQCFEVFPLVAPNHHVPGGGDAQGEAPGTAALDPRRTARLLALLRQFLLSRRGLPPNPSGGSGAERRDGVTVAGPPVIVFANRRRTCDALVKALHRAPQLVEWCVGGPTGPVGRFSTGNADAPNAAAVAVHAGMTTDERQRRVERFRKGQHRILVTTDVLARGLDVPGVGLVVSYEMPDAAAAVPTTAAAPAAAASNGKAHANGSGNADDDLDAEALVAARLQAAAAALDSGIEAVAKYVHRVGRTGRAGALGIAVSFVGLPDAPGARRRPGAKASREDADDAPEEEEGLLVGGWKSTQHKLDAQSRRGPGGPTSTGAEAAATASDSPCTSDAFLLKALTERLATTVHVPNGSAERLGLHPQNPLVRVLTTGGGEISLDDAHLGEWQQAGAASGGVVRCVLPKALLEAMEAAQAGTFGQTIVD